MHGPSERRDLRFAALPLAARVYVAGVLIAGAIAAATFLPTHINRPILFTVLLVVGYLTSTWKVNLPLPLANGSTLSVSYAADLMSLLAVGPEQAMVVAMTGAWAQCARLPKRGYPRYRPIFSVAAVALTMRAVAATYAWLNGTPAPASLAELARPLVGVIAVYFVINTGLVALAIALATRRPMWTIWRDNFLWSAPSFIVAGFAGALAAVVLAHGDYWLAVLLVAPVYLTYRTYRVFLGRIEDEQRHAAETRGLHREAVDALSLAQTAERALASEKERLAVTLRSVGDGVIAADTAGVVRVFNRAAEILTGWTHDEACGRPLDDVFHNLDADTRERLANSIPLPAAPDNPLGVPRRDALVAAEEACVRARQLTQQLLTFAKGGAPIKKSVGIDRIVMESIRMALSGATASWIADIDPALWAVHADEGQLIQVFNNVIINAKQAMPHGGRIGVKAENLSEPEDRWEFGLRVKAGPYVRVSIADEGVGISADDLPKIFDPYFSTKPTGTGLGLATSRSIVKNHGGYIAVESEVGRGTIVHVCLPASLAKRRDEQPHTRLTTMTGSGRLLVLDDEQPIRKLAIRLLRALGYDATAVSTGSAAIEQYTRAREEGRPFDLVLLDLTIPGELGGSEVLQVLKTIDPDVKAIVVSGYAGDNVLANYRDYGFKAVVTKPFTIDELSATLIEVANTHV